MSRRAGRCAELRLLLHQQELFQLLGDGRFLASALGVWAMVFLAVTIGGMSLLLGRKLGAIFRL